MTTAAVFDTLPPEYQAVLEQAQERYQIQITPLQELRGGQTGARLQLVSIRGGGRAEGHKLSGNVAALLPGVAVSRYERVEFGEG